MNCNKCNKNNRANSKFCIYCGTSLLPEENKQGRVVWKLSDWEFVDSMYGAVYNGDAGFGTDYSFNKDTVKTWNKMWKRYKIDTTVINYNLESEWQQIQQLDWDDISDEVTLGDPAMGVKG